MRTENRLVWIGVAALALGGAKLASGVAGRDAAVTLASSGQELRIEFLDPAGGPASMVVSPAAGSRGVSCCAQREGQNVCVSGTCAKGTRPSCVLAKAKPRVSCSPCPRGATCD